MTVNTVYTCDWANCDTELSEADGNTVTVVESLSPGPIVTDHGTFHLCEYHRQSLFARLNAEYDMGGEE